MIKIPLNNKKDMFKIFDLFKKKYAVGLEKAKEDGLITEEEYYRIVIERSNESLKKLVDKKSVKK